MNNKSKAVVYMIISAFCFALMAAMVKLAGNDIPIFEKVFCRNLVSLFIAFGAVKNTQGNLFGKMKNQKYLMARSLCGLAGMITYFYSINKLNLADSAMLNKLSPFFVTIFACMFLKEKLSKIQIPAMIVVFIAALLIIKPKFDLSILPAVVGFISAIIAGGAYTLVRVLKDKENPSVIVFYFSFVSVIGTLPFVIMNYKIPNRAELICLILTGVFAAIAQFALTIAYKYAPASEIAIYNYTNIVFSAIIGFFIFKEMPDVLSIIGGSIVILVAVVVFIYNRTQNKIIYKEALK
ncbi:DMT family transporter [Clostridium aestuarii]|uniref:DMT family transporter n=1 Tax=Clostridium aestuarii TaxID=338193 RepID=A0ABT4D174_9CLOT|nr:DMT family transporter [Clostridium aestuarii]MCY6484995.1 DMT family transporter [Clostridium aestuarii]